MEICEKCIKELQEKGEVVFTWEYTSGGICDCCKEKVKKRIKSVIGFVIIGKNQHFS